MRWYTGVDESRSDTYKMQEEIVVMLCDIFKETLSDTDAKKQSDHVWNTDTTETDNLFLDLTPFLKTFNPRDFRVS